MRNCWFRQQRASDFSRYARSFGTRDHRPGNEAGYFQVAHETENVASHGSADRDPFGYDEKVAIENPVDVDGVCVDDEGLFQVLAVSDMNVA